MSHHQSYERNNSGNKLGLEIPVFTRSCKSAVLDLQEPSSGLQHSPVLLEFTHYVTDSLTQTVALTGHICFVTALTSKVLHVHTVVITSIKCPIHACAHACKQLLVQILCYLQCLPFVLNRLRCQFVIDLLLLCFLSAGVLVCLRV